MDHRLRELERAAQQDPSRFVELALFRNRLGVCGLCGVVKNAPKDSANVFVIVDRQQIAVDPICFAKEKLAEMETISSPLDKRFFALLTSEVLEPSDDDGIGPIDLWVGLRIGCRASWSFHTYRFPLGLVLAVDPFRAVDRHGRTIRLKRRIPEDLYLGRDHNIVFGIKELKRITRFQRQTAIRVSEAQQLWFERERHALSAEGRLDEGNE